MKICTPTLMPHGLGSAMIVPRVAAEISGQMWTAIDSIVFNPHKWLGAQFRLLGSVPA